MKRFICIAICFFSLIAFTNAQDWKGQSVEGSGKVKSETRSVSGFNAINVGGGIDLIIHVGASEKLEVTADDNVLSMIRTEVNGGTLKIYVKGSIRNVKDLRVDAWVKNLNALTASGGTDVNVEGTLKAKAFKLNSSGGSDVNLNIEANDLDINSSGSSDVDIKGTVQNLNLVASGSSDIKAYELNATMCKLKVSGSSDAYVSVSGELDLTASGSSDVHYQGGAKITRKNVSGSSDVHQKSNN